MLEPQETYYRHDLPWFGRRAPELGEGYRALLSERDEVWLETTLHVPWFDFEMTMRDGLLQVLTHSEQHRAQVLSVLGARGLETPEIDYVSMVEEERQTAPR